MCVVYGAQFQCFLCRWEIPIQILWAGIVTFAVGHWRDWEGLSTRQYIRRKDILEVGDMIILLILLRIFILIGQTVIGHSRQAWESGVRTCKKY